MFIHGCGHLIQTHNVIELVKVDLTARLRQSEMNSAMSVHPQRSMSLSKRVFMFLLATIAVCLCYWVLTSRRDIRTLFVNITMPTDTKGFGGQGSLLVQIQGVFPSDKQKWRQTSLYEIFDRHKTRASESCDNFCDVKKDLGCAATNLGAWEKAMLSPELKFMPLLSDFEYIYPFEVDFLSYPPMADSQQLPSLTMSKVYLEGSGNGEVFCAIGDTLKGRADLVDGYGKQRTMGGDEVRVWMVDKQTKTYRANGHVIDMRNGSYQFSVRCLWPGKSQLNVAVAYPKEHLRTAVKLVRLGVTRYIAAKFKRQGVEEVTVCSGAPNIPWRSCLCNFTSVNQLSFYCGRPIDSRLTCDDFVQTYNLPIAPPQNVTPAEAQLIKNIVKKISKSAIHHNITIVANNTGQLPKLKPCAETSPASTWEIERGPLGYWTSENWQSLICERPKMTPEWTMSCLRNSTVWIFGDSNGLRLYNVLLALTKLGTGKDTLLTQYFKRDTLHGITLKLDPSEYPIFFGPYWAGRLPYGGVANQIDTIPSSGTYFIVIHYYLHLTISHLNIAYLRLTAVHDAIQRLISRNPNAVVGIRGPHVSCIQYDYDHAMGGDNLGVYLLEMIRDVFADLRHKVIFLDGWEMTVAIENEYFHPPDFVPFELMRNFLAFKCS